MRIAIATHYWAPHRGGVETVALEHARALAAMGHAVTVVSSRSPATPLVSMDDGYRVIRVPAMNVLERRGIPYPLFSPALLPLMDRVAARHDVVMAHSHTFLSSVAAALAARRHRRPFVVLQHNPFVAYPFPWSAVERAADTLLGGPVLRSASMLLAVSRHTASYCTTLAPQQPVTVLPNGVHTERFFPAAGTQQKLAARRRLGLPTESVIVLTLRRLVYRNGVDTLVEAAALLRDLPDLQVVIAGEGPQRGELEAEINRERLTNTRLLGGVEEDLLPELYRAADIFVLPTRTGEGFGLVLLEALASGLPVIATREGAVAETITDGDNGLLVPTDCPEALAGAIRRIYADREQARWMASTARNVAEQRGWDTITATLAELLQQAARQRR